MTDKTDALVALADKWHVRVLRDMLGGIPLDELHADQRRAMNAAIEALAEQRAEGVDVEAVAVPRNPSQDWLDKVANLLGIDSAEMDNIHAAILSATPQPAEGDGAVGVVTIMGGRSEATLLVADLPDGTLLYTRPSAAAAVAEYWVAAAEGVIEFGMSTDDGNGGEAARTEVNDWINQQPHPGDFRLIGVATPAAPKGGVDAYTLDVIEEAWGDAVPLTRKYFDVFRARLAVLRKHSLANQEPRHD